MTTNNTDDDGRLLEWYRTYVGEPDEQIDVYAGFALFFGGVAFGLIALVLFVYSGTFPEDSGVFFAWRTVTYALAMAGVPLVMLGVIVSLPVGRRGLYGGVAGGVICLAAIVAFVNFYPYQWEAAADSDFSVRVVGLYSLGVVFVLGSTGASLVSYHLERAKPGPADIEAPEEEQEETVSDEEVEADIEEAMQEYDVSWGGIRKTDHQDLNVNVETDDIDQSGMDVKVDRVKTGSVDDNVQGLQALQGEGEQSDRSESTVDDQLSQLQELKERKREEEQQEEQKGLLARIKAKLDGLLG